MMNTVRITNGEVSYLVSRLPLCVSVNLVGAPAIIAGGWLRDTLTRTEPKDLDIFAQDYEEAKKLANQIASFNQQNVGFIVENPNCFTIRILGQIPIQVIFRWKLLSIEQIMQHFDFTIACVALQNKFNEWVGFYHQDFFKHIAKKELVYTNPTHEPEPGGSILRMHKFMGRGYTISLSSLAQLQAAYVRTFRGWEYAQDATFHRSALLEVDPFTAEWSDID